MKGNKGAPFIFHNGFIYFCDLNLYMDDFKERNFYKVKIELINSTLRS
jgi:hypothetical protein